MHEEKEKILVSCLEAVEEIVINGNGNGGECARPLFSSSES